MWNSYAYIQLYLGEHLNESPIRLLSDFSTEVTHNRSLCTCNFPLGDPIRFLQIPKDADIYCPSRVIRTIGLYRMFRS